jgi:SAM-dependent methyltransferase
MYSKSQKCYDLSYRFKDYKREARVVHNLLSVINPTYKTYLDIASGTGEHATYLSDFYRVDGTDIDETFLEIARQKSTSITYYQTDMTKFNLNKVYDVVACLYSSIGYAKTKDGFRNAVKCFRDHLNPNGVILIEPWASPASWKPGQIRTLSAEYEGVTLQRMSETETSPEGLSVITLHHLLGENGQVEYIKERHELGLFSHEDYQDAFERANLSLQYLPDFEGLSNRGLYIGRPKS